MSPQRKSRFDKIRQEVSDCRTIPLPYRTTFEEALVIICKDFSHSQPRSDKGPRAKSESRSRHKQKQANIAYLRILEYDPHIFIPFVLAVTPKACENFDVSTFCQHYPKGSTLSLSTAAKEDLEGIGKNLNIYKHPHFLRLTSVLPTESKPVTVAEGDAFWAYDAVHPNSIEATFGSRIGEVNDKSAPRMCEKAANQVLVTQTVRAKLPRTNFQDGIMEIDIGFANSFARALFPHSQNLADLASNYPTEDCGILVDSAVPDVLELSVPDTRTNDDDYITFEGAAIWAIFSIFPFRLFQAIESSQLRLWEKEHDLFETTDCVTMKVSCKQTHQGTIRLRTGFIEGIKISNSLYAYDGAVH